MTMAIDGTRKHNHQLHIDFDPFDPDELTSHFFPGGNRQDLLDQLIESCSYSSDMAVVAGPLGSGKSTLAQWLAQSLKDDFVAVVVSATLFMSVEQLLEAICDELALEIAEGASTDELVEQLDQYAETLRARSKTLQLLVDDAHELGEETLQAILDLLERQADSSRLGEDGVKVVLFGESMLLNSVQQLLPSAHITFELEPLATDEVVDYVAFKLACAGFHGKFPLDLDTMTVIDARSQGIPGAINAMVKDELSGSISRRAIPARRMQPVMGFLERHLVAASVLFGTLLLALFFRLGGDNDSLDTDTVAVTSASQTPTASGNRQRIQVPLDISGAVARQSTSDDDDTRTGEAGAGVSQDPPASQVALRRSVENEAEQPTPPEPVAPLVAEVTDSGDSVVESALATQQIVAHQSEPVQENQTPPGQPLGEAERVLLGKSPDSYTLQLLGSHSEASVKNFIATNGAPMELSYFESRYQDRPWFVVVHGSYPDRGSAREAIDRLPPSLRELKPWARNLSDIHADIRSNQ